MKPKHSSLGDLIRNPRASRPLTKRFTRAIAQIVGIKFQPGSDILVVCPWTAQHISRPPVYSYLMNGGRRLTFCCTDHACLERSSGMNALIEEIIRDNVPMEKQCNLMLNYWTDPEYNASKHELRSQLDERENDGGGVGTSTEEIS